MPTKHLGELLFHSDSVDSPATDIGVLGESLFLGPELFVYVDVLARTLNFVRLDSGDIVTVGGHGHGPGEFQVIGGAFRDSQGNVVVDDWAALRATLLDPSGDVIRTVAYDVSMLNGGPGVPRVIGMTRTGALVVRDSDPWIVPRPDGLYRPAVRLVSLDVAAEPFVIAHGHGRESVRVNHGARDTHSFRFSTREIPFAHELFSVFHDDKLYIADTSTDSVVVASANGDVLRRIPLPPARIATAVDLRLWREQQIARIQERKNAPGFHDPGDHIKWTEEATGNSVAPRISGMFVDIAGRLWMQRYAMPTDSATYWELWQPDREIPIAVVRLPLDKQLLDAFGDTVLTSRADELGISSIAASRLAGGP